MVVLPLFIDIWFVNFCIKTLIIMSIFTNIHKPYVCDPIYPYISQVDNPIDPITSYCLTFMNYLYQYIN